MHAGGGSRCMVQTTFLHHPAAFFRQTDSTAGVYVELHVPVAQPGWRDWKYLPGTSKVLKVNQLSVAYDWPRLLTVKN